MKAIPMPIRGSIAAVFAVALLVIAVSAAPASASSEPKLAGTCPSDPFLGILAPHGISLDAACSVSVPTRAAGVIRCVDDPRAQFPIPRLEKRRYRGYTLSEESPWGILFKRGRVSFIAGVQCS
jgi:hypothetical protein